MFSFLIALTLYVALAPVRPALSVADYLSPPVTSSRLELSKPREVPPPRLPQIVDASRLGVETTARAAALMDWRSGQMLFAKNADQPLPIASMTKLMTALVALDSGRPFDATVEMAASDMRPGDINQALVGERLTFGDLFNLSLVASSNDATAALARATGWSEEDFVRRMNEKAAEIGLKSTSFVEPTGLDGRNVASAADAAQLVRQALNDARVRAAVTLPDYVFAPVGGHERRARNTDLLLGGFFSRPPYSFLGGKTGFIEESGYCFGAAAANGDGDKVIAVVLGAATRDDRFQEVKALLWWAFDAWRWSDQP